MKLVVNNEDGIDPAIGSSQSHCQGIETTQTWTVNIRYENMFDTALASCGQTLLNVLFLSITEAPKKSTSSHSREHGNL